MPARKKVTPPSGAEGTHADLDNLGTHDAQASGPSVNPARPTQIEDPDRVARIRAYRPSRIDRDPVRGVPAHKPSRRGSLRILSSSLLAETGAFSGQSTNHLGLLAHALVTVHAPLVSGALGSNVPVDLLERLYAVAYGVINANPSATRVLATEAAGLAYRYLTEFPPAAPWVLLGVEYDTGSGEVDLAWVNSDTREVFFDEIKTSRVSNGRTVPSNWLAQAGRYSEAGTTRFGDTFLGTRLIPLMSADVTRLVAHQRPLRRLDPTTTEPLRIASAKAVGR